MTTIPAHSAKSADSRPILVALAGSPGVGKTTVFYGLTGQSMPAKRHIPSPDKPVSGTFTVRSRTFEITDLPGLYSLAAYSPEERTAREFLLSGQEDIILFLCDGVCLERGLHLLRQLVSSDAIKEQETPIILCINFCDEMERRRMTLDAELLQDVLQIPVVCCCALQPVYIERLRQVLEETAGTRVSYDCLDFSPALLAAEAVCRADDRPAGYGESLDQVVLAPVLGKLLFFLLGISMAAAAAGVFLCAAAGTRVFPGMPTGSALSALVCAFALFLPAAAVFLFLFGLAETAGFFPRAAALFCRGQDILELPPYRRPRLRQVLPRLVGRLLRLIPWLAALALSAGIAAQAASFLS